MGDVVYLNLVFDHLRHSYNPVRFSSRRMVYVDERDATIFRLPFILSEVVHSCSDSHNRLFHHWLSVSLPKGFGYFNAFSKRNLPLWWILGLERSGRRRKSAASGYFVCVPTRGASTYKHMAHSIYHLTHSLPLCTQHVRRGGGSPAAGQPRGSSFFSCLTVFLKKI